MHETKLSKSGALGPKGYAAIYVALIITTILIAFFTRNEMIFGDTLNYLNISMGCKDMAPIINNDFGASCLQGYPRIRTYLVNSLILAVLGCFLMIVSKKQPRECIAVDLQVKSYTTFLIFWALFYPEILFKFGEPSKEFLVYYPLFIIGISTYLKSFDMFIFGIIGSLLVLIGRSESYPLYIICGVIYISLDKFVQYIKISKRPLVSWLTILTALVLGPIALKHLLFHVIDSTATIHYGGILGHYYTNSALSSPMVTLLNLFGGIRSTIFAQNLSTLSLVTAVYTLNYLWKACLFVVIIKERRYTLGLYIIASAGLLASINPYPHDRYMIPIYAIGVGMELGKMISLRVEGSSTV